MGILDQFYADDTRGQALRQGLLQAGLGMMMGANDPRNQGYFAPAMAQGLAGFQGGMDQVNQQALKDEQRKAQLAQQVQQGQLTAAKIKQIEQEMAGRNRMTEFFGGPGGAQTSPVGPSGTASAVPVNQTEALRQRAEEAIASGVPELMEQGMKILNALPTPKEPQKPIFDAKRGIMVDPVTGRASAVLDEQGNPLTTETTIKGPTEAQSKDNLFGTRMAASNDILTKLEAQIGPTVSLLGTYEPSDWNPAGGLIKAGVNALAGEVAPEAQQVAQAQRDFLNAVLRKESGAAIGKDEFTSGAKQYFPQPGDGPEVIAQKQRNRALAIEGIMAGVPESGRSKAKPTASPNAPIKSKYSNLWGD